MLETPKITQSAAQRIAFIPIHVPRAEIRSVMGPGLEELRAALAAQGIGITGPWFTHHRRLDPDVFDFVICVPVARAVVPEGRVRAGELLSRRVARVVYRGDYEGLGAAWGEFENWIAASGHRGASDFWEIYVAGPETGPDPSGWRTELNHPLLD